MSTRASILPGLRFQTLFLGLVVLLIFSATITQFHSGDDIQWAMAVRSSVTGEPMLHPASSSTFIVPVTGQRRVSQVRYFLELPTMIRIYSASRIMKLSENAELPIQFAHAVAGAVGAVFFFLGLALFVPRIWSIVITLGLTSSYAWWYYSTHLDYTIISHALSCILFYLLVSLNLPRASAKFQWQVLFLGIVNALAILFLLTEVLLIPVIMITLLLRSYQKETRIKNIALYLSSLLLAVFFFGAIAWVIDVRTLPSWTNLLKNLTYEGANAHIFVFSDVPKALYGFAKAILTYPALGNQTPHDFLAASNLSNRISFVAWYALTMVIVVSPFLMLARLYKQLDPHRNLFITLGIWFFIQVPFAIYWEPTYIKWWTGALIPWWGLIGVLVAATSAKNLLRKSLSVAVPALVVIVFSANFFSDFRPNSLPGNNPWLKTTYILGKATQSGDLFISSQHHPLDFYLPYFARRHTLSYDLIHTSKDTDATREDITEAMRFTTEQGGRIFVYGTNAESVDQFKAVLVLPYSHYEQIVFADISNPDLIVYEIIDSTR
jgi:hypothetical protein